MNIILGCNHLHELGGSEQHLYSLAEEFKNLNHNVYVLLGNFTLKGKMSKLLKDNLNIDVDVMPTNTTVDAVFLSHQTTINRFVKEVYSRSDLKFNDQNLFQICHGIFSELESPSFWHKLKYIAISEEVQTSVLSKTNNTKLVYQILNPINTKQFYHTTSNSRIENVYSLSQNDEFNNLIGEICKDFNYNFSKNNKHTNPTFDIRKNLADADLVFSLGRGCYEAMSMCKNVIVADSRGYMNNSFMDGLIHVDNFGYYIKNNCSGRYLKNTPTKENIIEEMSKYSLKNCELNRVVIKTFCDSKKIINDYLTIIE